METAAVYWEPKIKIYGFQEATNLSLLEIKLKSEQLSELGLCISALDDLGISFKLALVQFFNNQKLQLYLLYRNQWKHKILNHINKKIRAGAGESVKVISPVELICFQGPHFGDRHGIANSAFRALEDNDITILLAGCSGSAIHLVLPENGIEKARILLSSAFEVP